jgi:hypothetical protein
MKNMFLIAKSGQKKMRKQCADSVQTVCRGCADSVQTVCKGCGNGEQMVIEVGKWIYCSIVLLSIIIFACVTYQFKFTNDSFTKN